MKQFDEDNDGRLSYKEFKMVQQRLDSSKYTQLYAYIAGNHAFFWGTKQGGGIRGIDWYKLLFKLL